MFEPLTYPVEADPTELLWDDSILSAIELAEEEREREEVKRLETKYAILREES